MPRSSLLARLRPAAIALLLAFVAAPLAAQAAYPKPASIPYRWELEFAPGELRLYESPVDGSSWWFFSYQVTNRTGRDQVWAPRFVLYTDTGEILGSGENVPARVANDIKQLMGNDLIEMQNEAIGDIHQGREHAKDGLVIWPAENLAANEMSLFISGISGETARVQNPITGESTILRKTLHRQFLVRGNAASRGTDPVEVVADEWVMR